MSQEHGRPIYEAAVRARDTGRRMFTCAVEVASGETAGLALGKRTQRTTLENLDPSILVESIEALGWRLHHLDHVWQMTENTNDRGVMKVRGSTVAHMVFRRVEAV